MSNQPYVRLMGHGETNGEWAEHLAEFELRLSSYRPKTGLLLALPNVKHLVLGIVTS